MNLFLSGIFMKIEIVVFLSHPSSIYYMYEIVFILKTFSDNIWIGFRNWIAYR